jgi:hypothetical protein
MESTNGLRAVLATAFAIPLAVFAVNPDWFITNIFLPPWFDAFIYRGLFQHPVEYIKGHPDYYPATRMPYIAYGAAFYALLPPLAANFAMKLVLAVSALATLGLALLRLVGASTAILVLIVAGTYPFFVMAMGWDYIDGFSIVLTAAAYACIVTAARRGDRSGPWDFLAGLCFGLTVACNLFAVTLAPSLALFYLAVLVPAPRLPGQGLRLFARIAFAIIGLAAALGASSGLSVLFGGGADVIEQQLRAAIRLSGPERQLVAFAGYANHLPVASWLILPAAAVLAAIVLALRSWRHRDVFAALMAGHYLVLSAIYVWVTAVSLAALLFWFYVSYLLVPAFVTIACALGPSRERASVLAFAAIPLVAVHLPWIGAPAQLALGLFIFSWMPVSKVIWWTAPGLLLTAIAHRLRSWRGATVRIAGVLVLAAGWLAMLNWPQLCFYPGQPPRIDGFRAALDAVEFIRAASSNPRRYLWVDREEPAFYGLLFHSIWIESLPSSKYWPIGFEGSTKFPALPPHEIKPGDPLVILTSRPDWRERAEEALRGAGLSIGDVDEMEIRHGAVAFKAAVVSASTFARPIDKPER